MDVCRAWRRCSTDPRELDGLDRRLHPRRWIMLREQLALSHYHRLLNLSTGETIKVDLLELNAHMMLTSTPEGLLMLLHERIYIRLLNPLTHHLIEFPPVTTLLKSNGHGVLLEGQLLVWGSFIDTGSISFVLHVPGLLGIAKPGDACWKIIRYESSTYTTPLMFMGRFYCVTDDNLMVLETSIDPRLEVAVELHHPVSPAYRTAHLVDNGGKLMLVHRELGCLRYDVCHVDLEKKALFPVKGFNEWALFLGKGFSFSVCTRVFPFIKGSTIYLSFDFGEKFDGKVDSYYVPHRSAKPTNYDVWGNRYRVLPSPHSVVDCLSLCNTVKRCCVNV
uniref:KIB1-4 beta-propeller domain-containing protein n=1 Tax=Aegilops tauschii TaxID=37682 RepID=M8BGR7_AEGTA